MTLVTISREIGSQGVRIAKAVAAELGATAVDQQVLTEMARQMGVTIEVIRQAEGRLLAKPVGVSDEMRALISAQRAVAGAMNEAQFLQQMTGAINRLAEATSSVFIGRGAQMVLKDHPTALHVHLYAPAQVRAQRVQQQRALPDIEAASRLVQQGDEQHKNWYRHFFSGLDWKNARYYHLMIDTARFPAEVATALIIQAVQAAPVTPAL